MKGIVFTLDAMFALIIAVASLSILLYFYYFSPAPYTIRYSEASSIMSEFLSTKIGSLANGSATAESIAYQALGANETWPQFMNNAQDNAGNPIGPLQPSTSFIYQAPAQITTGIVADCGNIYFATGNIINAVNGTTGMPVWRRNVQTPIYGTPALYNNMLIFANASNLTAVNANSGAIVWSTNAILTIGHLTSPIKIYEGKAIFGATNYYLYAFFANNGTMAWSNYTGASPTSISAAAGSLALRTSGNTKMLIVTYANLAKRLWSYSYPTSTTNITTMNNIIIIGAGASVNGTYTDDSPLFSTYGGSAISGVSAYGNYVAFQGATTDGLLSSSGSVIWSASIPSTFGSALTNAYPVVSNNFIYTLWSNGYLLAQNISNGNIVWYEKLPTQLYGNNIMPYMTLAYGRLYVAVGSYIIAFGSCNANPDGNALYAMSSMYINNGGSCATALANYLYPMENYSIFINGKFAPGLQTATFNGANSIVMLGNENNLMSVYYTWSIWFNASSWAANTIIIGQNNTLPGSPFMLETSNATVPYRIEFTVSNGAGKYTVYAPVSLNSWQNIIVTYASIPKGLSILSMYVNGALVSSAKNTTVLRQPGMITLGNSPIFSSLFFKGKMANVQIYNRSISAQQALQIYLEGIGGAPVSRNNAGWWPMEGNANDYSYSAVPNTGYPLNVNFAPSGYLPAGMQNAFEIAKASVPTAVINYTSGLSGIYNVGVYAWH